MTAQPGPCVVCVEHAGDRHAVAGISYVAGGLGREQVTQGHGGVHEAMR
jgi:hypothetical protein